MKFLASSEQPIPENIREEAAYWLMERDADPLSPQQQRALAAWLRADPRHARAFERLERSWDLMGSAPVEARLRQQGHGGRPSPPAPARRKAGARRWAAPAIAAGLAAAAFGLADDWPTRLRADAMTAMGEQRTLSLPDGSSVLLNTASAVAVDYRGDARRIRLLKGEASFTVAADRDRPFTVEAGDGATRALGTRFIVRRDGGDTDVLVTEHSVQVTVTGSDPVTLRQGEGLRYGSSGVTGPGPVDASVGEAWTRGRLVFVDRPLAEVVAELNRYLPAYIGIVGGDLRERRFSGVFDVRDPMAAIDTIQRTLRIESLRIANRIVVLHR
ncbi:hypothetical protein [Azospirillum doebereinerae]